jgi:hypothetical protein
VSLPYASLVLDHMPQDQAMLGVQSLQPQVRSSPTGLGAQQLDPSHRSSGFGVVTTLTPPSVTGTNPHPNFQSASLIVLYQTLQLPYAYPPHLAPSLPQLNFLNLMVITLRCGKPNMHHTLMFFCHS